MSFMPLTAPSFSAISFVERSAFSVRRRACLPAQRSTLNAEPLLDVVLDDLVELAGDVLAAQGHRLLPVDEDGGGGRLAGAGQADADVGMLALARAVDDAAHHG